MNSKKVLLLALSIYICCSWYRGIANAQLQSAWGTTVPCDPPQGYIALRTASDLEIVRDNIRKMYGYNYFLCNDIDLQGVSFTPMGHDGANPFWGFMGLFEGNGKTIRNLTIQVSELTEYPVGFFAAISPHGEVRNLRFTNAKIDASNGEWGYVGILAGVSQGKIHGIAAAGSGYVLGQYAVGGLIGEALSPNFEVYVLSNNVVGSGYTIEGLENVGGMFGIAGGVEIRSSLAHATVRPLSTNPLGAYSGFGGLVGEFTSSRADSENDKPGVIYRSGATGAVSGPASVGGLVGEASIQWRIEESFARGSVRGDVFAGGLVGDMFVIADYPVSFIKNSYAQGSVGCYSDDCYQFFGGLIGYFAIDGQSHGTFVSHCFSTGQLLVAPGSGNGAFAGEWDFGQSSNGFPALDLSNLFDKSINAEFPNYFARGASTAQMVSLRTYRTYSMSTLASSLETTWKIDDGHAYPRLRWEIP